MTTTKKKPVIREATAAYLERSGLRYLERYAASAEKVRTILMRKVKLSAGAHGTDAQEGARVVERLVQRFVAQGLIRDRDLAMARAERLHEKGASRRMISAKLGAMGLGEGDISAAIDEVNERSEGDSELEAAWSLARRKRLGPYRDAAVRKDLRNRDLGVMARGGFSYSVAHRVIDADGIPER
jgi:regulatory protein